MPTYLHYTSVPATLAVAVRMSGAGMRHPPTRPCFYDDIRCDDCDGTPRRCTELLAQDHADDDGSIYLT